MRFKFLKQSMVFALAGGLFLCPALAENAMASNVIKLQNDSANVTINNEEIVVSSKPFAQDGYTMVPLRFISENVLQAVVNYDNATQSIELIRGGKTAHIDLLSGEVKILENGVVSKSGLKLPISPIIRNDVTYVPLRFFSEIFGCLVDYNSASKVVTIVASVINEPEITQPEVSNLPKPTALVQFNNVTFGQNLDYMDSSSDPNGHKIVAKNWRITYMDDEPFYYKGHLRDIMNIPSEGYYNIGVQVQNDQGVWSDWYSTSFTVYENKAPEITDLYMVDATGKKVTSIAQGEAVDFVYEAKNEEWEDISKVSYSYSTKVGDRVLTKAQAPSALFGSSDYEVTLRVYDACGNVSEPYSIVVKPKREMTLSELEFKMANLKVGEPYLNIHEYNFNDVAKQAEAQTVLRQDVKLLSSNNPESVTDNAILYQDSASGDLRLRFHHKNMTGANMWLYAVAKNETDVPITLTIKNLATAGPSDDVITVGAGVVSNYLKNDAKAYTVTIAPNEVYVINSKSAILKPEFTSAGLVELNASGTLEFSILALPENMSPSDYEKLPYHQKNSTHIRGTFPYATMEMSYVLSGEVTEKIVLGREDAFADYYVTGVDAITGDAVANNGNRGVLHKLTVTAKDDVAMVLNPRGTSYYGTIKNIDGQVYPISFGGLMKGIYEGGTLGVIEAGQTVNIEYLAPSGSDTPLLLVAIPKDVWYKY